MANDRDEVVVPTDLWNDVMQVVGSLPYMQVFPIIDRVRAEVVDHVCVEPEPDTLPPNAVKQEG